MKQNKHRRLTPRQCRKVNMLIRKECCNCDHGNCILLDDGEECICPQIISCTLLCSWFQNAVLPADKELYAEIFKSTDRRRCTVCGAVFVFGSNRAKYCPDCQKKTRRRQAAERMRRLRSHVTQ